MEENQKPDHGRDRDRDREDESELEGERQHEDRGEHEQADDPGIEPSADEQRNNQEMFASIADELRRLARRLTSSGYGETMQPTALVNELYLKLLDGKSPKWTDKRHLMRIAAQAMRQLVIDHKRAKKRLKRGGDAQHVPFDEVVHMLEEQIGGDILGLDEALKQLADMDATSADLITLTFFGGRTIPEAAKVVGLALRTAEGRIRAAKAWLKSRIKP